MGAHRTGFYRSLMGHALRWRAQRDHGDSQARTSPMLDDWLDGVYPPLRDAADRAVTEDRVRLHSHVAGLTSSMVFGFNLFLPARQDPGVLAPWVSAQLGVQATVHRVQLEWVPPGGLLAELHGELPEPDEPATGIDVVIRARVQGEPVAILVEVKLSEGGFTTCSGRTSRGNRRPEVCADARRFLAEPDGCYLTRTVRATRDRRYWTIYRQAHGTVAQAFPGLAAAGPCPFAGDLQQPMRQLALALALEQSGTVTQARVGLVHHDDNPDVPGPWQDFTDGVAEPERLFATPASTLLSAGPPAWARWMRSRYRLPETP